MISQNVIALYFEENLLDWESVVPQKQQTRKRGLLRCINNGLNNYFV